MIRLPSPVEMVLPSAAKWNRPTHRMALPPKRLGHPLTHLYHYSPATCLVITILPPDTTSLVGPLHPPEGALITTLLLVNLLWRHIIEPRTTPVLGNGALAMTIKKNASGLLYCRFRDEDM
jgi:hypothetical protein